jgi:hypothetical protein
MTPRFQRRPLSPGERRWALQQLAQGSHLPAVARRLGITPGTLKRALLEWAWQTLCVSHGVAGVPLPAGSDDAWPLPPS